MIAVDTCSLIVFFEGEEAADKIAVREALRDDKLVIPPVVMVETLSDPYATNAVINLLSELSLLEIAYGYWQRTAALRKKLLTHGLKAKLGDALIAQSCIDYNVPLITRDKDFRHYVKHCGLKLYA